jgi:hypothetical protein
MEAPISSGIRQRYVYRSLEAPTWMRILSLHPSKHDEVPLHCEIQHVDREAMAPYDAISYAWGQQPDFSRQLLCWDDTFLPITPGMENMLIRLCSQHKTRKFWIDAVCIYVSQRRF